MILEGIEMKIAGNNTTFSGKAKVMYDLYVY